MDDTWAERLAAAQSGDESAFTEIFRTVNPALVRFLRVLAGPSAAEDLAAETWVSALRTFATFAGDERAMRTWLITIARARWVDSIRSSTRRPELVTDEVPELAAVDDVHAAVEIAFTTDWALSLIGTLPSDQAEIVTLRVVAQLEVAEVAQITGKTANHVRVLTHRGLKRLAAVLSERDESPL